MPHCAAKIVASNTPIKISAKYVELVEINSVQIFKSELDEHLHIENV